MSSIATEIQARLGAFVKKEVVKTVLAANAKVENNYFTLDALRVLYKEAHPDDDKQLIVRSTSRRASNPALSRVLSSC